MKKLTVAGVPEHFNLPWHLAIDQGIFQELGVDLRWQDFSDGTGAMMRAAANQEVDIALVLTEGAIAHITQNQSTRMVGTWVESPLVWGVHSGPHTKKGPHYPHDGRVAISRYGSGSHLMPLVHAHQASYDQPLQFVEIGNLPSALQAFEEDRVDTFYWERTMTVPQVQAGQLVLDGDFQAPWPAFVGVRAGGPEEANDDAWATVLLAMGAFMPKLLADPEAFLAQVSQKYDLPAEETQTWFERTAWAPKLDVDAEAIGRAQEALLHAGAIEKRLDHCDLLWDRG